MKDMADFSEIKSDSKSRMDKTIETLRGDFGSLRAGRLMSACWTALWLRLTVQ